MHRNDAINWFVISDQSWAGGPGISQPPMDQIQAFPTLDLGLRAMADPPGSAVIALCPLWVTKATQKWSNCSSIPAPFIYPTWLYFFP